MSKGDGTKEYKKSKLTPSDGGIRIIGINDDLEFTRNLFNENFSLHLSSRVNELKNKKKYGKTKGKKWDKEIRIIGSMKELEQMEKLLEKEFNISRISDIYILKNADDIFVRYFKIKDK